MRRGPATPPPDETRTAWAMCAPALLVVMGMAVVPVAWTFWESLHLHDLRMPWRGRPFVGAANYVEALQSTRFRAALAHTFFFTAVSVALETVIGLFLALGLDRAFRGRGLARTAALLPWAMPTVVAALIWRFVFESPAGSPGPDAVHWLSHPVLAWLPIILADVWKTTPFVTILVLAGLQGIDPELRDAARVDGAGYWQELWHVTLPLLRPTLLVAVLFRSLDAFRVFDLVYVLTGGGPGTATEPVALLAFTTLLQNLRFGYGSALAFVLFGCSLVIALAYIRVVGRQWEER